MHTKLVYLLLVAVSASVFTKVDSNPIVEMEEEEKLEKRCLLLAGVALAGAGLVASKIAKQQSQQNVVFEYDYYYEPQQVEYEYVIENQSFNQQEVLVDVYYWNGEWWYTIPDNYYVENQLPIYTLPNQFQRGIFRKIDPKTKKPVSDQFHVRMPKPKEWKEVSSRPTEMVEEKPTSQIVQQIRIPVQKQQIEQRPSSQIRPSADRELATEIRPPTQQIRVQQVPIQQQMMVVNRPQPVMVAAPQPSGRLMVVRTRQ